MYVYDIASVVGRFSGNFWMEATDFVYGDGLSGRFGRVGVVLLVRSNDGYVNLGGFGREILSKIHEEMKNFGINDGEGVKEMVLSLQNMFADVSVEVLVFGIFGDEVLLAGVGGGGASLLRAENFGKILNTSSYVSVVTGKLTAGDVLVLGSADFYNQVVYSDMKILLSQGMGESQARASGLASQIAVLIQDTPVGNGVSALVLVVGEKKKENVSLKKENKIELLMLWWKRVAGSGVYLKDKSGISPKDRRKKRLGILILILILIVFLVSVGVRARNKSIADREERVAQVVGPVRDLIKEASETAQVNKLRSRSLLLSAKNLLSEGAGQFPEKSAERNLVLELLAQVETDYQKISGENRIEPQVFLDLSLVSSGFVGGSMNVGDGRVLVLSDNSGVVIEVEASSKKAKVLAGGIDEAKLVAVGSGGDFVLTSGGVVKIESDEKKMVIPKEDVWADISAFGAYGSNIYVLDKSVGEIWKYIPNEEGYVSRRWLAAGVEPNFSDVTDMYIDGDIWLLDSSGVVRTYSGGVPKSVETTGLADEAMEAKAVVATEERIWVLDRKGKRVVGFDREGVYQEQFLWDGFSLASDMAVFSDNDREVMLVLSGEKIYEIQL